jgi:hypothetical protein
MLHFAELFNLCVRRRFRSGAVWPTSHRLLTDIIQRGTVSNSPIGPIQWAARACVVLHVIPIDLFLYADTPKIYLFSSLVKRTVDKQISPSYTLEAQLLTGFKM